MYAVSYRDGNAIFAIPTCSGNRHNVGFLIRLRRIPDPNYFWSSKIDT
jgi:hypothetical protein